MTQQRASLLRPLIVSAAMLEASFVLIHFARSPAEQVLLVLLSYLAGGAAFGWLLWKLRSADEQSESRWAIAILIGAGLLFRLTLWPLPSTTSTDVHRYLWEGLVQLGGFSPYVLAPSAPELAPLAAEHARLWQSMDHHDLPAIYPPVAQSLFLCNAVAFGGSLLGWKLILLVFDGLLAVGVWSLLRQRSRAIVGLAGVLWCPLLLLETYEGGHLDIIGVAWMVLAIVAVSRGRPIAGGIALGLSINVKYLWPLLVLILLTRETAHWRRRIVLVAVAAAVALAVWIPYWSGLENATTTARTFAEHWRFNDVIFQALRKLPGPRWLPMALVVGSLALLAGGLALRRSGDVWRDAWLLTGTALLLSPVAYPWYFLWIVPGMAVRPPAWLVVWVLSVPVLHLVDWHYVSTGRWDEMARLWPIVGAVPAALLLRAWWQRLTRPDRCGTQPC